MIKQVKQYEYVDLGLPSGLKWAKCNVGAEKETDYGDYFMWGSITPNTADECNWAKAPFNGGASDYDSDYFNSVKDTVCPNGVLAKEYDAASQIMGGDWRMPTKDEFDELMDNTTTEWIEDFNGSGVNCIKFTSNINGNSIFFPASGFRTNSSFGFQGYGGYVWSSSLGTSDPSVARSISFESDDASYSADLRRDGYVVRGVCE